MAINRSSARDLLLPGLADVEGKYPQFPTRWKQWASVGSSKMAMERVDEMRYTGMAQLKQEGGATTFDNAAGQRFTYVAQHINVGLGFAMTREMLDDNLYKEQFGPSSMGLAESFAQFKEVYVHSLLNTATTYNSNIVADGVPLLSTAHPIDNGTYANTPTVQLDFNESSVEYALNTIRLWPDQAGLLAMVRARKVVLPVALSWAGERLFKTELRTNTANNDVSAIITSGAVPDGYMVSEFLTSAFAWFVVTSVRGLMVYDRVPYEMDIQVDPVTGNLLVVGYERYAAFYRNPRGIWGSTPSA
jgi:hypothetical protein